MSARLPVGQVIPPDADGMHPPLVKLSKKEMDRMAKDAGMVPIRLRRILAYSDIGRFLSSRGAQMTTRGMAMIGFDQCEDVIEFINKQLPKTTKGDTKDGELMVELLKIKIDAINGKSAFIDSIAAGAVKLKGEDGDRPEVPQHVPTLGDMGKLGELASMKVTQTILEVNKSNEALPQRDHQS